MSFRKRKKSWSNRGCSARKLARGKIRIQKLRKKLKISRVIAGQGRHSGTSSEDRVEADHRLETTETGRNRGEDATQEASVRVDHRRHVATGTVTISHRGVGTAGLEADHLKGSAAAETITTPRGTTITTGAIAAAAEKTTIDAER